VIGLGFTWLLLHVFNASYTKLLESK